MMSMDGVPTRTSMEGAGFYNEHSSAQAAGIDRMLSLLEQAATDVPVGEEVVVLADYGASQGRNSMAPMRVAIEAVRAQRGLDKPVWVFHSGRLPVAHVGNRALGIRIATRVCDCHGGRHDACSRHVSAVDEDGEGKPRLVAQDWEFSHCGGRVLASA